MTVECGLILFRQQTTNLMSLSYCIVFYFLQIRLLNIYVRFITHNTAQIKRQNTRTYDKYNLKTQFSHIQKPRQYMKKTCPQGTPNVFNRGRNLSKMRGESIKNVGHKYNADVLMWMSNV